MQLSAEIAVVGAGVIGLAVAEALVAEGREVVLIDPNPPGSGASYGNAGTIADYAVMPVGSPEVLRRLPSLLLDRNSPLAIRRAGLIALLPWLARFLAQSRPAAAARNTAALAGLVAGAGALWRELAERIGAGGMVQDRGCLYLHDTAAALREAHGDMAARREWGVASEVISASELAALEPGLPANHAGATFFPGACFLSDPGQVMERLHAAAMCHAGFLTGRVDRLTRQYDGVMLEGEGFRLRALRVVLATGAHGRALARMAGDRVPLETERGYHVEWDMRRPRLSRPACPVTRGFYLCPMTGRLRVAGTVELGGLEAPPSPHRIARLIEGAREIFPDLGEPDRTWMGFRPSLPDSLPVIGPSAGGGEVIHAFGHGHIGLTLAPITARLVADLIAGREPERDIAPLSAGRF
jgi:D-hydroxyproline dehydrogenase